MSGTSRASVSLHLGDGAMILCHAYPNEGPILSVSTNGLSLSLSCLGRGKTTARDVKNARRLVEAARAFLTEVERLAVSDDAAV